MRLAAERGVPLEVLGIVGGERFALGPVDVALADLARAYDEGLAEALRG